MSVAPIRADAGGAPAVGDCGETLVVDVEMASTVVCSRDTHSVALFGFRPLIK